MEYDFAGLFGPPRRRKSHLHAEDPLSLRGHGRRMEGESTVPPLEEGDSLFYAAESLEYFKNGMDKNFFEWVNPKEIVAGGTTCGFLKPALGTTPRETFPSIKVYVCMRFANIQPASKGNIFTHCGGPGSLSSCIMPYVLGRKALDDYNFLTIDQVSSLPQVLKGDSDVSQHSLDKAWYGAVVALICPWGMLNLLIWGNQWNSFPNRSSWV